MENHACTSSIVCNELVAIGPTALGGNGWFRCPFHRLVGWRVDSRRGGCAVGFSSAGIGPGAAPAACPCRSSVSPQAADLTGIGQERKMCRRLPGDAGRKRAGRARPAKFTGNKPQAREKRTTAVHAWFFVPSQAAVAAGSVGSMNIKSSVHAAVQKLAVARRQNLARGSSDGPYRSRKRPDPQARPSVGNQAASMIA